jgi:hypothetical protein
LLYFLLIDLVGKTERRVKALFEEIEQLLDGVPDRPAPARKGG